MYFSVPADFQISTIHALAELEKKYPGNKVREVFGNLSGSKWPSGHGFLKSQRYAESLESLKAYVAEAAAYGIEFNYTFNAGCLNNGDILKAPLEEILSFVGDLVDIGVNRITVASPALMKAIHKRYPNLRITASAITHVDSVMKAAWLEEMGVQTIVLDEDITRNFQRIRSICAHTPMDVEIIVNSKCTFNCLYRNFHYNSVCHDFSLEDRPVFSYGGNCAALRHGDPVQLVKALWIRPEDLDTYAKQGVTVFKIIGRERLSDIDLLKMVEAYFAHSYEGNLVDLIFGFATTVKHLYLDNKKLDGFLDKFLTEDVDCLSLCTPDQCTHCHDYLEKALVDQEKFKFGEGTADGFHY